MQGRLFAADDGPSFQARSAEQGRLFHEVARDVLESSGFSIEAEGYEILSLGVEVNLVLRDALGNRWFCEVTGAYRSRRPGLVRTDTVRKVLGTAHLLALGGFRPFIVLTTNLPSEESRGERMLRRAGPNELFDVLVVGSRPDRARLRRYAKHGPASGPAPGWWSVSELEALGVDPIATAPRSPQLILGQEPPDDPRIIDLRHQVGILIPSKTRAGTFVDPLARLAVVMEIVAWLSERNGGLVRFLGNGVWVDPAGSVIFEEVTSLHSWGAEAVTIEDLMPFLAKLAVNLDQESIAVTIDGRMKLLPRPVLIEHNARPEPTTR